MSITIKKLKKKWWTVKSVLAQYYYNHPSKRLKIIGITGTNGKTTTATLLYEVTRSLGYKVGLIGTVAILANGEKVVLNKNKVPGTTPDSVSLTKIFSIMEKAGCEYVFMEVSSHAMDQRRVARINFTGGIFTNLSQDHLDYHKSMQNYFEAKKKFFKMLPKGSFALSNGDDEHGNLMLEGIEANKYFYGFSGGENFHGEIFKKDFSGFEARFNNENIKSKLLGKFNIYNMLSVWSAASLLGFDMKKVKHILEDVKPPVGRFEYFISESGVIVIVDYAHTPDALEKALLTAREIKPESGKLISVFGCGGDRDALKRRIMGKIGAQLSDVAIFTSDNPRNENPEKIIEQMKTDLSMGEVHKSKFIFDRLEAITASVGLAIPGDIILCAGKGHETYQEIKNIKHPFSDMEEFKKLLDKN